MVYTTTNSGDVGVDDKHRKPIPRWGGQCPALRSVQRYMSVYICQKLVTEVSPEEDGGDAYPPHPTHGRCDR